MWVSEPFLRIASEQLIYISAAAGEGLPTEADLYESGDTFALVGDPAGAYHLSQKSGGRNAKIISSAGMVAYLAQWLGMEPRVRFPVWFDSWDGRRVTLFSNRETHRPFDGSFSKVTVPYRKLVEGRVLLEGNQLLLPVQALEEPMGRYDLFETEEALVLRPGKQGRFQLLPRANPRYVALDSQELVACCHRKFGQKPRLRALRTEAGAYISKNEEALYRAARRETPTPLDVIPTPRTYLTLNNKWTMYLSAEAGRLLEGRISVLEHNGLLALRREPGGTLEVSPCAQHRFSISSKPLKERILYRYPDCKRLLLVPYGDILLLTQDGRLPEKLPPARDFCRLELYQPKAGVSWLRVRKYHVELSRLALATLSGPFSVYEGPDALRFVLVQGGALQVCESRQTINSAALSRAIREKFGVISGDKLHAEQTAEGLLIWPAGCPHPEPKWDDWPCLDDRLMRPDRSLSALIRGNQVDFSVRAALALGERVSLTRERDRIRIRNRVDGPYKVHNKGVTGRKYIASVEAARFIRRSLGTVSTQLNVRLAEDGVEVMAATPGG